MRRLAKIAAVPALLMMAWGLVELGLQAALLFGGFSFAVVFMLLFLARDFVQMLAGGPQEVTAPPTPEQVVQEQASMRAPDGHRFAFVLLVAHLPGGVRHEARVRLWDLPDWRGSVQVWEFRRNHDGFLGQTELRNGPLPAADVARLRELLDQHGTDALDVEPPRVIDGSPASLYLVERGAANVGSGHMNVFDLASDDVSDQATHDFFLAVLQAAGLWENPRQ